MFWWSLQKFLEQLFYRATVQAAIGGVLYKKLFLNILQYSQVNTYYLFIYLLFVYFNLFKVDVLLFCNNIAYQLVNQYTTKNLT